MTTMRRSGVLAVLGIGLVIGLVACGGKPAPVQPGAGPQTEATPAPTPAPAFAFAAAAEPSCAELATRVVKAIAPERGQRFRENAAAIIEIVRTRCQEDSWTVESRRCMAGATDRGMARDCFRQLTQAQQDALERDEKTLGERDRAAEPAGGAAPAADRAEPAGTPMPTMAPPPPPPAAQAPARRPPSPRSPASPAKKSKSAPKGGTVRTDPCEGGE
jgi:hypothetical protein